MSESAQTSTSLATDSQRIPPSSWNASAPITDHTVDRLRSFFSRMRATDYPIELVRVIADDRPAAWLKQPTGRSAEEFDSLLNALPVHHRTPPKGSGRIITSDPDRFDLLPDADADPDTFDLEMGLFLGYPRDAIDQFLAAEENTIDLATTLVRRGHLDPSEAAYVRFVPWVRSASKDDLERQIEDGKQAAHRLFDINARCGTKHIAECVAFRYHAERRRLAAIQTDPDSWIDWLSPVRDGSIITELNRRLRIDTVRRTVE